MIQFHPYKKKCRAAAIKFNWLNICMIKKKEHKFHKKTMLDSVWLTNHDKLNVFIWCNQINEYSSTYILEVVS